MRNKMQFLLEDLNNTHLFVCTEPAVVVVTVAQHQTCADIKVSSSCSNISCITLVSRSLPFSCPFMLYFLCSALRIALCSGVPFCIWMSGLCTMASPPSPTSLWATKVTSNGYGVPFTDGDKALSLYPLYCC